MKKTFAFLLPFAFLLFLITLPKSFTERTRDKVLSMLLVREPLKEKDVPKEDPLRLQNTLLNQQVEGVREWLLFEERIEEQIKRYMTLQPKANELYWNDFFRRRSDELKQILEGELQSLPAKVIYRDLNSWSSSVWVNIGEATNEAIGRPIIAKNSPVVTGESLVGVVEYVGRNQSRVRLITDSGLVPSVRAVRGETANSSLLHSIEELKLQLTEREDLFPEENKLLFKEIDRIQALLQKKGEWYLAKGELHGTSLPCPKQNITLKGIGFNYAYADEEGLSCDLKKGLTVGEKTLPLIKEGDVLLTSGLDGVFPRGLFVATVSRVFPLKEGAYAYEIEARPKAKLDELQIVFILPPVGFERE